jgi:hypothetical protein
MNSMIRSVLVVGAVLVIVGCNDSARNAVAPSPITANPSSTQGGATVQETPQAPGVAPTSPADSTKAAGATVSPSSLATTSVESMTARGPITATVSTAAGATTGAATNPCGSLKVAPMRHTVPACGTPLTAISLAVTASPACAWANNYRVNSSQPSWIYPVPIAFGGAGNGTLKLSLNANYSRATRTGSITLLVAGVTATLTQPRCK